jgi:hypothetical protein
MLRSSRRTSRSETKCLWSVTSDFSFFSLKAMPVIHKAPIQNQSCDTYLALRCAKVVCQRFPQCFLFVLAL